MSKNNYLTILDFGKSKLRLGVFNENLNDIYSTYKNIVEKENYDEYSKKINLIIKDAEKKISNHLENIIVLYDNSEIHSVDLSIKKDFDQIVNFHDINSSITLEANRLIKNNYIEDNIIHFSINKYILDGKEYIEKPTNKLMIKSIIVEIKFICLPKEKYNKIVKILEENNLQVLNFYCSSYVKSFSYINSFKENRFTTFLDIGWKRSTITIFENKKIKFINSISIGGNHISKDISNILKLDLEEAENIKKSFNNSEIEFSYNENISDENNKLMKEIIKKNISVELLKKVILARIEEIIELAFKDMSIINDLKNCSNSILVLTGDGSKIFNKNSFHLNDKYNFREISFYEESNLEICNSGLKFFKDSNNVEIEITSKLFKKEGFFEKFFKLFAR
tara:strand:- start:277 stop:1458 length:1182 start_codon:yes stop_codon:yes gene_type:complete